MRIAIDRPQPQPQKAEQYIKMPYFHKSYIAWVKIIEEDLAKLTFLLALQTIAIQPDVQQMVLSFKMWGISANIAERW